MISLNENAHALRPVRAMVKDNRFRVYTATTFKTPFKGCHLTLRRCDAFGYLKEEGANLVLDVLDKNGDIIQDFPLTKKGFEYLRRVLRFKVETW